MQIHKLVTRFAPCAFIGLELSFASSTFAEPPTQPNDASKLIAAARVSTPAISKPIISEPVISEQAIKEAEKLFGSGSTEADFFKTDELLISATGSLKPVSLAPSVATVITKQQIEAMGATTLDEVLETVPGLHITPSNLVGPLQQNYSIRGILTNFNPQILLLVNGVPVKHEHTGIRGYRFILPVAMISRVEVIRGPGSAVHGADAFAGTINVITKDGQEINGVQAGGRVGSFSSTDVWLQYGGKHAGWNTVAGFEYVKNGSDPDARIDSDLQTTLDGSFNTSASQAPNAMNLNRTTYVLNLGAAKDHWDVKFWAQKTEKAGLGVGVAPVLDNKGFIESDRYALDVLYKDIKVSKNWRQDIHFNYGYYNSETNFIIFPAGATLAVGTNGNAFNTPTGGVVNFPDGYIGNPNLKNKTSLLETISFYDGIAQHNMRFSLGYKQIDIEYSETKNFGPGVIDGTVTPIDGTLTNVTGTPNVYAPDKTRKIWYATAQDEWAFAKDWELTAGVRFDDYSDFGNTINPRLALVWQTRYDLVSKFLYGRAFRAPTVSELFITNNPVGLGNPNLDPETIDTYEFAFDYRPTVDVKLNANIFYYEINGLIEYVSDGGASTKTAQNARDQVGHGLELAADWEASRTVRVSGNMAFVDAEDKKTGFDVANTPKYQAYTNVHWKFKKDWSLDGQVFWISGIKRANTDSRKQIDDYSLVNFTLRRKNIVKGTDIAFAIRNALDANAREPSNKSIPNDIPLNSRSVWLELRTQFDVR